MIFAQFTSSDDSSVMILCNPRLYTPYIIHHLSFHFYWLQDLICSNCKLKTLVYSRRYDAILVKNNKPFCGKFHSSPHHRNRPGHVLKRPMKSCETLVFLELVPGEGRKSKNSNVNNFLSSYFTFQSELFPKFVFWVEKLVTLLLFQQLPVH